MKILFIVPSYKPAYIYGGPIVVIARLAEHLVKIGHEVTVYTTTANGKEELDVVANAPVDVDGVRVYYFKRITKDHTHVSLDLWKQLNRHVKEFDVVHIHSWWSFLIIGVAWICKRKGIKPVLSPHGMLSNYILDTNNSIAKRLLHAVIGKKLLKNTWLHVSTKQELDESLSIIKDWKGCVVPNLVQLPANEHSRNTNKVFTIGFLSRLDPKKGLDVLIKALGKVNFPYKLLVAGDGEKKYIKSLQEIAIHEGVSENIEWVGWKKGEEKFEFFSQLDLFALTSHSENFAIVVIEALSVGTPVLISDQVGLHAYVFENDMGWVTDMNVDSITTKLNSLVLEKEKQLKINTEVSKIILREYDDTYLTKKYLDFYLNAVV